MKNSKVINVNKIILGGVIEVDIEAKLYLLDLKTTYFDIKMKDFLTLIQIPSLLSFSKYKPLSFILENEQSSYFCSNCLVSCIYNQKDDQMKAVIISMDYILEGCRHNREEVLANNLSFKIKLTDHNDYINIKNIEFKYNDTIIKVIKNNEKDKKIDGVRVSQLVLNISIETNKKKNIDKLETILFFVYELLVLKLGKGLKILNITFKEEKTIKSYYKRLIDKYNLIEPTDFRDSNIVNISSSNINDEILEKWIELREETEILFDVYLFIKNSSIYNEMKLTMLIQNIEGFYRIKKSGFEKSELTAILKNIFNVNNNTKMIINKNNGLYNPLDRNFVNTLVDHRNYYSHFKREPNKIQLVEREHNYVLYKTDLAFRIIVLNELGVEVDESLRDTYIKEIDERYKPTEWGQ